ncbi:hypothetical protein KAFR_0B04240 [Kazachstania africana CBS 2517]|uniref:Uncharacterized protein n=1 Tax=Kazachstania africana (strain ATCC 22294 / BCRC 22015 / CBS 2517 / CECT 1963 / NBRC 1671 / NRRL Y-8276) TaxID=1071382 RepID=H2AQS0_KAZAF|nr:hypothetical protein KAFR_0B04240 [Kazachstania africana CBS 2517]CCF56720.1 hypothetical protein KAFR_0B04240 [Kazachstania africana CBS 2517]
MVSTSVMSSPITSKQHTTKDKDTFTEIREEKHSSTSSHTSRSSATALRKTIFKNKKGHNLKLRLQLVSKFHSPTDRLISPCSQKLNSYKSNIFKIKNAKPTKLEFQTNPSSNDEDEMSVDSDTPMKDISGMNSENPSEEKIKEDTIFSYTYTLK